MPAHISITKTISENGYALIRNHRQTWKSLEAFAELGLVDVVEGLNEVQKLTPQSSMNTPPNTYSGNFGMGEFPLHTDLAHWSIPPKFLALRCVQGTESVATRLLDSQALTKEFGLNNLRTILVQPRRPMSNGKQLLQILERVGAQDQFRFRWDSLYLRPATTTAAEFFARVLAFISTSKPTEIELIQPGDTLVVDNWRCLHGRAAIPETARTRQIDRAYLMELA